MSKPVIITCAITGSIHTPSQSPHLPITPDDIDHPERKTRHPSAEHPFRRRMPSFFIRAILRQVR